MRSYGTIYARAFALCFGIYLALVEPAMGDLKASEVFHICQRSDPQLGECIKQTMKELVPKLVKGIPELKMPPHEPLFLPKAEVRQGRGAVNIDSIFTNQTIRGVSNLVITAARANIDKNLLEMEFYLPYLHIAGKYNMNGRVLLLPISGEGFGESNYTDVSGRMKMRGHRETRDGKEYLEPDTMNFDMVVKKAKIHMDNLFHGDKVLGETMNQFLEQNWEVLFAEIKPVVDESIGSLMLDSARKVFRRFPLDELFPK